MGERTLSDRERRSLALFEQVTGATGRDCVLVEDDEPRVLIVVAPGEMGKAIGEGGERVRQLEDKLGMAVKLVEDADTPADFVANALAPAAVYDVTIAEDEETVAKADVAAADEGVAIGEDGRNVEDARLLAARHFDVSTIEIV